MSSNQNFSDLRQRLLTYLRSELKNKSLNFLSPPTTVEGGYDTIIYRFQLKGAVNELARPLILRLYRGSSQNRALFESVIQNSIASSGYPVPRVYFTCTDIEIFGSSFIIMELMPGETMLNIPESVMPEMLADAHLHLHSIDVEPIRNALDSAGIAPKTYSFEGRFRWLKEGIERRGYEWLKSGLRWIEENYQAELERLVICHGDFHPLNILVDNGRVSGVLDWTGFLIGDPAYDIGITRVLGTIAATTLLPRLNWVQLTRLYYDYYQKKSPVNPIRVMYYEAFRCLGALLEGVEGHSAWGQTEMMRKLSEHFKKITGIDIVTPKD